MFRPIITKVGLKPLQGSVLRSAFLRSTPLKTSSALFLAPVAKRFATHQAVPRTIPHPGPASSASANWPRILGQAGIIGATIFGLNIFFNRETREGGIPAVEQQYLHDTFKYVGVGLGITALAARGLHLGGWTARMMAMNPWMVLIGGLALSIGTSLSLEL
jgi:hypothetical protein